MEELITCLHSQLHQPLAVSHHWTFPGLYKSLPTGLSDIILVWMLWGANRRKSNFKWLRDKNNLLYYFIRNLATVSFTAWLHHSRSIFLQFFPFAFLHGGPCPQVGFPHGAGRLRAAIQTSASSFTFEGREEISGSPNTDQSDKLQNSWTQLSQSPWQKGWDYITWFLVFIKGPKNKVNYIYSLLEAGVLKVECASESPRGLVKTQLTGFLSQSFWSRWFGVKPEILHFQEIP